MARTETIKDFAGRFIAIYEYHDNGDIPFVIDRAA